MKLRGDDVDDEPLGNYSQIRMNLRSRDNLLFYYLIIIPLNIALPRGDVIIRSVQQYFCSFICLFFAFRPSPAPQNSHSDSVNYAPNRKTPSNWSLTVDLLFQPRCLDQFSSTSPGHKLNKLKNSTRQTIRPLRASRLRLLLSQHFAKSHHIKRFATTSFAMWNIDFKWVCH